MSGHVDGLAQVVGLQSDARSLRVEVEVPAELARYIAPKGSVGLDGVSLTVNSVEGSPVFGKSDTSYGGSDCPALPRVGQRLNLEVDQLARYVERGLLHLRP